jgi:hypothetical protein
MEMVPAPSLEKIPRFALVYALLAGMVLALMMAVSPQLHDKLHHDESDEHHECLATVLHAGGCDDAAPASILAGFVATFFEITSLDRSVAAESLFLSFRILEHAPPRRA